MKIIEPKAEILTPTNFEQETIDAIYNKIELAGRTCYKSENNKVREIEETIELLQDENSDYSKLFSENGKKSKMEKLQQQLIEEKRKSSRKFVSNLIKHGHEAMIEHAFMTVRFTVDRGVSHELVRHRIASLAQESTRYCVAGDTILRSMTQKQWTVEELYKWQTDIKRKGRIQLINLRSVDEKTNRIVANHIKKIYKIGEKETYKITTETGRSLTCTADHEIYTPNGYKKLSELCVNDVIYSNGAELLENKDWLINYYIKQNHTRKETAEEIGCCESYVYRAFKKFGIVKPLSDRPNRKPGRGKKGAITENGRRILSERMKGEKNPSYINNRIELKISGGYAEAHRKYDENREKCEFCGSTRNIEIHHINKNPKDNDSNNIHILCSKCHKAVHKQGTIAVIPDKIISIEYAGIMDVYDVEMCEPYRNFVANSIVVHNCNYSQDKFGNELTFIKPCFWDGPNKWNLMNDWQRAMQEAENRYLSLLNCGATPEEARTVLPNSVKTEVVVTANMREWRNIFKLRAAGTTGKPHPQMVEVMLPLLLKCQEVMPELFGDIKVVENE